MKRGFTLIELLVVISIISLLSSVVLSSVNSARDKARVAAGRQFDATIKHVAGDYLVGEWLFDDAGNRYADTSGSGNNGSCTSCPSVTTGFNGGSALSFNGGTYVVLGNSSSLNFTNAITLSLWVKTGTTGDGPLFSKGVVNSTTELSLGFGYSNPNLLVARPYHYNFQVTYPHGFSASDWHFLAMSVGPDGTKLYVDGKLVSSNSNTVIASNSENLTLGRTGASTGYIAYYSGAIDDARMYNKVLTASEIGKIYALERPLGPSLAFGLTR